MPDTIGQVTGVRALRQLQLTKQYLAGERPRPWHAEQLADRLAEGLKAINHAVDVRNAIDRAWFLRLENMELHALRRDRQYGSRSRKWIYSRAQQTKLLQQQEIWIQFVKWHVELEEADKYLTAMLQKDPAQLSEQSWETLLRMPQPREST